MEYDSNSKSNFLFETNANTQPIQIQINNNLSGITNGYQLTNVKPTISYQLNAKFNQSPVGMMLLISEISKPSVTLTFTTSKTSIQGQLVPNKSGLNAWINGSSKYTGAFTNFMNFVDINTYFSIGNVVIENNNKVGINYVPSSNVVPFITINGQSIITAEQYLSALPNNNGAVNWNVNEFQPIQSSSVNGFVNTMKYLISCYEGNTNYSEIGLINAILSETSSDGLPMYSLNEINITSTNAIIGDTNNANVDVDDIQVTVDNVGYFMLTSLQWAAGPGSYWATNLDQAYLYSLNLTNHNYSVNNSMQSWVDNAFNSGLQMYYPATNNALSLNNVIFQQGGSLGGVNNWVHNAWTGYPFPTYVTSQYQWSLSDISFSDWLQSYNSYYSTASNGYVNGGVSYFTSFGSSYYINPVYIQYGVSLSSWNAINPVSTATNTPLFIQGTPLFTSGTSGWWNFSLYGYNSNNCFIYGLNSTIRNQWPGLIYQFFWMANNAFGKPLPTSTVEYSLSNQFVGTNSIEIPILNVVIAPKTKINIENSHVDNEFSDIAEKYNKLSSILASTSFSQHNVKLMYYSSLDDLINEFPTLLSGSSFNAQNGPQLYATLALIASHNYNLTQFITNIVEGYPFSSIPAFIQTLLEQIALQNPTFQVNSITSSILNSSIDSFFSTPSPSKVTYTGNNTYQSNVTPDMSLSEIKTVQKFLSEGAALASFASDACAFIAHIHSMNLSGSSITTLEEQWNSITSNWNKVGESSTNTSHHYTFLTPEDDVLNGVNKDIINLNEIVSSAMHLSDNPIRTQSRLKQAIYNQHHSRCDAISILVAKIGDDLAQFNPWTELGSIITGTIGVVVKSTLSIVKLIAKFSAKILTGVSDLTAPGGLIEGIFSNMNQYLPDNMANYPYITSYINNSVSDKFKLTNIFSTIPMVNGTFPNLSIINPFSSNISITEYQPANGSLVLQSDGTYNLVININNQYVTFSNVPNGEVTRYDFITPHGVVYFWIDTKYYISENLILLRDPDSPVNILGFEPVMKLGHDGLIDKLKTVKKWIEFIKYLPLLFPNTKTMYTWPIWQQYISLIDSTKGLNNQNSHISTVEYGLIESSDAIAAALTMAKAVDDACTFNFSGTAGYSIYSAEMICNAVQAASEYSRASVANVANAFINVTQTMEEMMSDFLDKFLLTQTPIDLGSLSHVINIQKSDLSLMLNGVQPYFSNVSYLPQAYSVSLIEESVLITMKIGKFALSNYAQIKLYNKLKEKIVKQRSKDQQSAKIKTSHQFEKMLAGKLAIGKWERYKSNQSRSTEINNQTGTVSNDITTQTNTIENGLSTVTESITSAVSGLRGLN